MFYPCEAGCLKWFQSLKAMNAHLPSAKKCAWYLKGKLRDLGQDPAQEPGSMQTCQSRLDDQGPADDYGPDDH